MIGAIVGDIVGSRFEFNNHRCKEFELFTDECFATDDSIMTLAVAKAIIESDHTRTPLRELAILHMQNIGQKYPDCGYGGRFFDWVFSDTPKPYNSYGNGAAMRVSPAGFMARTEHEAMEFAQAVTEITHNHPEGLKGAEAITVAIFMARQGATKSEIRERMSEYYDIDFRIDDIRDSYGFDETCQGSVPQAIVAFLDGDSFEDVIRTAISLGGDSDTIAAIAGPIAEAHYGIPDEIKAKALTYLDNELRGIYDRYEIFIANGGIKKEEISFEDKFVEMLKYVPEGQVDWKDGVREDSPDHIKEYYQEMMDTEEIYEKEGVILG